jgi:hypothetical protein
MLRTALAMFMIGGMAAWGLGQNDTSRGPDKVDRAAAYYHYALACLYAEMDGSSRGRNPEYASKAIENYKAAVKADPQTPGRMPPRFVIPAFRLPAPPHAAGASSK